MVEQVTDVSKPEDGNRAARKSLDKLHLMNASPEAQTIKLADLIDNSKNIIKYDPKFAAVYIKEKAELLEILMYGHPLLYKEAAEIVKHCKLHIK